LLEGADETEGVAIAHRYIEKVTEPVSVGGRDLVLAASIGVAVHTRGADTGEELVRRADVAMYAAKRTGGGQCEVYRSDMAHDLDEALGLEHKLRQGLQRGEFSVHYQPEIDFDTEAIVGVEALVRWYCPTRGIVMPGQFIPIAETTDLILPLGEFVLREACLQTERWRQDGLLPEPFVTWVNLSGRQLSKGGVRDLVRQTLQDVGLPAHCLGLEVTETALAVEGAAGDRARAELEDIHALGVHIAIDYFGTGYSSLEQLRRFPIDVIKVDRSFIQGVERNAKDAAITANLASLAHALGLVATAEGIESEGQLASVRELCCDHAQGFLFAHPVPAGEIGALLAAPEKALQASGGTAA